MAINQNSLWCRKLELSFFSDDEQRTFDPELHIEFDIEKTRASEPNKAVITVYNLSEETRAQLKSRELDRTRGEYKRVRLLGGYDPLGESPPLDILFDGFIRRTHSQRDGADIATVIELGDGDLDYRNVVVNRSFAKGTRYSEIIDYIRSQMPNVGIGNLSGVDSMGSTDKGYTIAGWGKRYLDEICRKFDCRWSIQNGALEIIRNDTGIERNIPLIRPSYCDAQGNRVGGNMIGIPVVNETGITVTTLLQPNIRPNTLIAVDSQTRDASDAEASRSELFKEGPTAYRVNNVRMVGSNFSEEYYTIAECQSADGISVVRTIHNGEINL